MCVKRTVKIASQAVNSDWNHHPNKSHRQKQRQSDSSSKMSFTRRYVSLFFYTLFLSSFWIKTSLIREPLRVHLDRHAIQQIIQEKSQQWRDVVFRERVVLSFWAVEWAVFCWGDKFCRQNRPFISCLIPCHCALWCGSCFVHLCCWLEKLLERQQVYSQTTVAVVVKETTRDGSDVVTQESFLWALFWHEMRD